MRGGRHVPTIMPPKRAFHLNKLLENRHPVHGAVYQPVVEQTMSAFSPSTPSVDDSLVSILLCTIDRFDLTRECFGGALANADYPFEILVTDNGSQDKRVVDYIQSLTPAYHRVYKKNKGFPFAMNQMMLRAKGDYIVLMDNDTAMPNGWLRAMVAAHKTIPETGQVALYSLMERHPVKALNGLQVCPGDWVFGERLFHRSLMDRIGAICMDYGNYGLDDADWSHRIRISGLLQYYLHGLEAVHRGWDIGERSAYRQMKDACLQVNGDVFRSNIAKYEATKELYVPFPPLD